jgi:mannosyltransferase OCH1-like enzyme
MTMETKCDPRIATSRAAFLCVIAVFFFLQVFCIPFRFSEVGRIELDGVPTTMTTMPPPREFVVVPLAELAGSHKQLVPHCDEPLVLVKDTLLDPALAFAGGRKIPRIVHVTSRSRCMNKVVADNLDTWRLKDHSFFMHDDEAMDKLLYRDWPEFPQLQDVLRCVEFGGAVKADIWRILVLWEYGGIYTDIDNTPALFNADTITAEDDAFFVVEEK